MEDTNMKKLTGIYLIIFAFAFLGFTKSASAVVSCEITKENGGGFTTTIEWVECEDGLYTIILRVESDGSGQELSHYSVEADPGTYSNISIEVIEGSLTYEEIDYGPNLGSDPFQGFKIEGTENFGDGNPGIFTITYTLTYLQDQQVSAKAGQNANLASFTLEEFEDVMNCYGTGCGPDPDPDGDGCIGEEDEYPDDPERCYSVEGEWGTLAYEDLWPSTGDYDFNDNVIIYQTTMVYNSENMLVDIITDYKVTAVGASFRNGLAIQFDNLVPEDIASVTGSLLTAGYVNTNSNGTEAGPDKAVVYVFDDAESVLHRAGGPFFNTLENGNIGTSDTTTITVYFNPAIDPELVGDAPFNPFLIKDGNRDIEIHLPDYEPTSLADPSYFGTSDDDSDPASGRYYKTSENLPWGIHIPEVLDHMIEYIEIPEGYLHFSDWAESGGTLFQDWYKDLPGYRDDSKIWYAD